MTTPMPKDNEVDEKVKCPKCGAPCDTEVHSRGGDWGWGTTDLERTTYKYDAATVAELRGRILQIEEVIGGKEVATEDECQIHRSACFALSSLLINANALEVVHEGGTEAAWKNIIDAVKSLTGAPA